MEENRHKEQYGNKVLLGLPDSDPRHLVASNDYVRMQLFV